MGRPSRIGKYFLACFSDVLSPDGELRGGDRAAAGQSGARLMLDQARF